MIFSSPIFLFLFLPLALSCYYLAPGRAKNYVLIAFSLAFYFWGEPSFVFVALVSTAFDWIVVRFMGRARKQTTRKWCVALGVVSNVGILFYFKYVNFFAASIGAIMAKLGLNPFVLTKIALPIGVSFIVFEKITYLVDVYRGVGRPSRNFANYLLYVFFFPKLLAGPIIKYHDIADQLRNREHNFDNIVHGLVRFAVGLAKKVLIADTMAEIADFSFGADPATLGPFYAWLGVICFTFQIYFDFSGYSDMAIGLARMMGFRLLENFNMPYISQSFSEFWRRWHISLSSWIRDYLYIPLGGNRVSTGRLYFNLWFCFLLSGLWHGANWTFVIWGAYHGVFLVLDRLFWTEASHKLPKAFNIAVTFFFVVIGWTVFRAESIGHLWAYLSAMLGQAADPPAFKYITSNVFFFLALALAISFVPSFNRPWAWLEGWRRWAYRQEAALGGAFLLLVLAIGKMSTLTFNPFIYFRF